jgi:ElaB/YqjD/DUF883 family membrane-anchored ribosome-binding protein
MTTKKEILERLEWLVLQEVEEVVPTSSQDACVKLDETRSDLDHIYKELRELIEDIKRDVILSEVRGINNSDISPNKGVMNLNLGTVDGKDQVELLGE